MNTVHVSMLGLTIAMVSAACSAQLPTIPFAQIEQDTRLSASLTMLPPNGTASIGETSSSYSSSNTTPEIVSPVPFAAGFVRVPAITPPRPHILDTKFYLLNGLHLGLAVFDVEMTQHCIAEHRCREVNPLMPSSQAGQLSLNLAYVGAGSYMSYKLKKRGMHLWWLSPTMGIAAHSAGAATGISHR